MTIPKMLGAGLIGAITIAAIASGQDGPAKPDDKPKVEPAQGKGAGGGGFPDLVKGLKATPGCLGVETAKASSGKLLIFAWFKDKKAALAWYNSDMHKGLMEGMGAGQARGLRHMADDGKPVMVVASITPSDKPKIEGFPMPISQISIEIYQPLPGGASIGGTFAPKELDIPQMRRIDEEPKDGPKPKEPAK